MAFSTAESDYIQTEVTDVIHGRLCMNVPVINNYLPGTSRQFSVLATSTSHSVPTATTTVIITDDG